MRYLLSCLLLICTLTAGAQPDTQPPLSRADLAVMKAGSVWLLGDRVTARRLFRAAAQDGNVLAQYNLAMMLLHSEGGPCGSGEARALLHKAAAGGVDLALEALDQARFQRTTLAGPMRPFPCLPSSQSRRPTMPSSGNGPAQGQDRFATPERRASWSGGIDTSMRRETLGQEAI